MKIDVMKETVSMSFNQKNQFSTRVTYKYWVRGIPNIPLEKYQIDFFSQE